MDTVPCTFCGEMTDRTKAYRRLIGWAKPRGSVGGTNALVLADDVGLFACRTCIDLARQGIHIQQAALF